MKTLSLLSLLLLTACAGTGDIYRSTVVPETKAQVVVYRPSSFVGSGYSPNVEINGRPTCRLANGSFFVRNLNPGQTTLSASAWDLPGTSRLSFDTRAGQQYFVRTSFDSSKVGAFALGGMTGALINESAASNKGPYFITLVPEGIAKGEVAKTNEATSCE